jgi:hypothetical protein
MNEITVLNELKVLSPSKAEQIEAAFKPMLETLKDMEAAYDMVMYQEISPELCKKAKRLRLDIAKIRLAADKVRKTEKEQYKVGADAIQGMYNILKFGTSEKEESLKNLETHYERIEADRKQKCEDERQALLLPYYAMIGVQMNLSDKTVEEWEKYLAMVKAADQSRLDKIESDRIAQELIDKKEADEREERIREDERKKITAEKLLKSIKAVTPENKGTYPGKETMNYSTRVEPGEPVLEILDPEAVKRIANVDGMIDDKKYDYDNLDTLNGDLSAYLEDAKTTTVKKAISQCIDIITEARGWL